MSRDSTWLVWLPCQVIWWQRINIQRKEKIQCENDRQGAFMCSLHDSFHDKCKPASWSLISAGSKYNPNTCMNTEKTWYLCQVVIKQSRASNGWTLTVVELITALKKIQMHPILVEVGGWWGVETECTVALLAAEKPRFHPDLGCCLCGIYVLPVLCTFFWVF